jgi:DNA-binding NarL/FixJ family response regulator
MRCFWEQTGVLGPIYRLVGRGLSDSDIADNLDVTELSVQSCVTWMLHFLKFTSREELVLYASSAA